jgi:hypothetical protein
VDAKRPDGGKHCGIDRALSSHVFDYFAAAVT